MRQLLDNAVYAPTRGRFKVYVIDEVHMLSSSAFNAMLKTLEEPPEHIKFILATTDPQKIPVTVLSRCLQFNLKQHAGGRDRVAPRAGARRGEDRRGEPGAAADRARRARAACAMRSACSIRRSPTAGGNVTEEAVRGMLGTVDTGHLFEVLEAVAAGDASRALAVADAMEARSLSFDNALGELARLLHRVALAQVSRRGAAGGPARARAGRSRWRGRSIPRTCSSTTRSRSTAGGICRSRPTSTPGFTMTLMRMLAFAPGGEAGARVRPATDAARARGPQRRRARRPRPLPRRVRRARPRRSTATGRPLARALKIVGAAKQLAERSELASWNGTRFELAVPQESRALADKSYVERLKVALREHLGRPRRAGRHGRRGRAGGPPRRWPRASAARARTRRASRWTPTRSCRSWSRASMRPSNRCNPVGKATAVMMNKGQLAGPDEAGAADAGQHAQDAGAACDRSRSRASRAPGWSRSS